MARTEARAGVFIDLRRRKKFSKKVSGKPGRRKLNALLPNVRAPRPSRTAQAYRAAERLFRHGLETFAPKGAFLLQMLADGDQLIVADALFEPIGVDFQPMFGSASPSKRR
jgi:hypothetical protein